MLQRVDLAVHQYKYLRDRLLEEEPDLDQRTLADTIEGLTDLNEIVTAIIRSALEDDALAAGLKSRVTEMQERLSRLEDRASKRRQIARGSASTAPPSLRAMPRSSSRTPCEASIRKT